jgi:hypothetical protein
MLLRSALRLNAARAYRQPCNLQAFHRYKSLSSLSAGASLFPSKAAARGVTPPCPLRSLSASSGGPSAATAAATASIPTASVAVPHAAPQAVHSSAPAAAPAAPSAPLVTRLADYTPPPFLAPDVALTFDIADDGTCVVTSALTLRVNVSASLSTEPPTFVSLDGHHTLTLLGITVNGVARTLPSDVNTGHTKAGE